jgi:glycosyltransferase involved in cell wall biosynthesis
MLEELASSESVHVALHARNGGRSDTDDLTRLGIRIISDLDSHFDDPSVSYDIVIVSRPHNGRIFNSLIARRLPEARKLYDAEALYYVRLQKQAAAAVDPADRSRLLLEADDMRRLEARLARDADAVICISRDEAELVRQMTSAPIFVVPALLTDPRPTTASFKERHDLGFVAGWLGGPGSPNSEALLWFAREVLPLVQAELPDCRLLVTGATPPSDVRWLEGADVQFVGLVPDLYNFYNDVRVAISPARTGAGVKLKTVEAVQYGVPVVATSEGAAGLEGAWREVVHIADSPEAFAAGIVDLMRSRRAWQSRRQQGLTMITRERARGNDMKIWGKLVLTPSLRSHA